MTETKRVRERQREIERERESERGRLEGGRQGEGRSRATILSCKTSCTEEQGSAVAEEQHGGKRGHHDSASLLDLQE